MIIEQNNRTFNGRTWEQVLSELIKPFNKKDYKKRDDGHPYLDVHTVEKRLADVLGIQNYSVEPWVIPSGMNHIIREEDCTYVTVCAKLTIYDDDGCIFGAPKFGIASSKSYGTSVTNYDGELVRLISLAGKRAMLDLCMENKEDAVGDGPPIASKKSKKAEQPDIASDIASYEVILHKALNLRSKAYRAEATKKVADGTESSCELVLWESTATELATKYDCTVEKLLSVFKPGVSLNLKASIDNFRGKEQLIVKGVMK